MRGEAFWCLKNPKNPGASRVSDPWTPGGTAPGPHQGNQGPLSGPLDPTLCTLRSTIWSETNLIQSSPVTNPAQAPHARNKGVNSLKIHIGSMHKRYMIVQCKIILRTYHAYYS